MAELWGVTTNTLMAELWGVTTNILMAELWGVTTNTLMAELWGVTTNTLMAELWGVTTNTLMAVLWCVCCGYLAENYVTLGTDCVMSSSLYKLTRWFLGKKLILEHSFQIVFVIYIISISDVFLWSLMLTWLQVIACCHQAPSHHLNQCWPSSTSPYGVTRQQWATSPCGVAYTSSHVVWFGDVVCYVFLWSSTLIQAMAWCCLGPSHCLNQCWRRHTGHQTLLCGWALFQYDLVAQHWFR